MGRFDDQKLVYDKNYKLVPLTTIAPGYEVKDIAS
jgi:hypothetical protein